QVSTLSARKTRHSQLSQYCECPVFYLPSAGGHQPHLTQRNPVTAMTVLPSTRVSALQRTSEPHCGQFVSYASFGLGPKFRRAHFLKRNHFCLNRALVLMRGITVIDLTGGAT